MRTIESRIEASDNGVGTGIQAFTGRRRIRKHYTLEDRSNRLTYAGLHESRPDASKAKLRLAVIEASRQLDPGILFPLSLPFAVIDGLKWLRGLKVIELQQGELYKPWGTLMEPYRHGDNDGMHGSKIKETRDARLLLPRYSFL